MKESIFTTEVLRSLRALNFWAYKIPDTPITKEILSVTRFTVAKPCDIIACRGGHLVAIETKQIRKWKPLSHRDFRPEQKNSLKSILDRKGSAFCFLNVRIPKEENRLIVFDWSTWGDRLSTSSIHVKELKTLPWLNPIKNSEGKLMFDLCEWTITL